MYQFAPRVQISMPWCIPVAGLSCFRLLPLKTTDVPPPAYVMTSFIADLVCDLIIVEFYHFFVFFLTFRCCTFHVDSGTESKKYLLLRACVHVFASSDCGKVASKGTQKNMKEHVILDHSEVNWQKVQVMRQISDLTCACKTKEVLPFLEWSWEDKIN